MANSNISVSSGISSIRTYSSSSNIASSDSDTETKIRNVIKQIEDLLLEKNRKYGNSALDPIRVFSKADALEQIKVRIDDKLSRVKSAQLDEDEEVLNDLIGYLILYRVALS